MKVMRLISSYFDSTLNALFDFFLFLYTALAAKAEDTVLELSEAQELLQSLRQDGVSKLHPLLKQSRKNTQESGEKRSSRPGSQSDLVRMVTQTLETDVQTHKVRIEGQDGEEGDGGEALNEVEIFLRQFSKSIADRLRSVKDNSRAVEPVLQEAAPLLMMLPN